MAIAFLNLTCLHFSQFSCSSAFSTRGDYVLSDGRWPSFISQLLRKLENKTKKGKEGEGRVGKKRKFFKIWWIYVDKLSTFEWNGPSNIKGCVSESWGLDKRFSLSFPSCLFCSRYNFLIQLAREHLLHRLYVYNVLLVINGLLRQRMWLVPAITS